MSAAMRRGSTAALKSSGTGVAATSVTGVVRYTPESVAVQMTTGAAGGTELVIVDDVAYLRTGKKVQGKNWLRFDGTGTDPASPTMGWFLATIHQQSDPAAAASGLSGVPLTLTGSHTVDGVVTTGYQFRQSGDQMLAGLPEAWRAQYVGSLAGASAVTEVWLDTEGLPRRNTSTSTVNGTTSTATVDFSRWGEPVTITAPPASEVTTLTG
jgi:hypothetical protein